MTLKFEPWGDDFTFDWDDDNREKMYSHRIWDYEVEQCFYNPGQTTDPHPKRRSEPAKYRDRFIVHGVTNGGRRLVIIVQHVGANIIRPITAWEDD